MYVCVYIYTCLRVYMYIHNLSVRYLLVYVCFSDYFCVCFFSNTMKPFILSRNPCALKSIPDKENSHKVAWAQCHRRLVILQAAWRTYPKGPG